MNNWGYKVVESHEGQYWDSRLEQELKDAGEEGWELVHISERPGPSKGVLDIKVYLKRPLKTPNVKSQIRLGGYHRKDLQ